MINDKILRDGVNVKYVVNSEFVAMWTHYWLKTSLAKISKICSCILKSQAYYVRLINIFIIS